ncbi:hypothetical protein ACOSP7_011027 [Xanthoceras sorbifolium]
MVANREKINCTGRYLALPLDIQGYKVKANFYILPVAACQLVLGVQWLATLGPIEMNYQRLTMTFYDKGTSHTFQGMKQSGLEVLNEKECHHIHGTMALSMFSLIDILIIKKRRLRKWFRNSCIRV